MAKEEKKAPKLRFNGYTNDWERKKLGILITRVKSYPLSRSVEVKKETDVKYVHYGDIHTNIADEIDKNNNLPFINEIYKEYDELKLDDVIVADASEDYKGIADAAVIISNLPYTIIAGLHTIALRPTSLIKGYFLYHIFKTENFKRFGYKIGTGLKVFGISYNNLAKYKVYYPQEIEEQEKIIGILSNLTNSINLHERKCEELALIKKALLQNLFPKKDEIKPEVRYKNFSDAWEQRKFFDNIEKVIDFRGRTPKKLGMKWSNEGYVALSALNVKDGYIDFTADVHYANKALYDKWMVGNDLYKGQVLFTTEAPMGNVAQIPDNQKYVLSQRTIAFDVFRNKITNDFLAVLLRSQNVQHKLKSLASGGTAQGVSQKSLSQLKVTVPTRINEQQKIGEFFKQLDSLIALHQRKPKYISKLT